MTFSGGTEQLWVCVEVKRFVPNNINTNWSIKVGYMCNTIFLHVIWQGATKYVCKLSIFVCLMKKCHLTTSNILLFYSDSTSFLRTEARVVLVNNAPECVGKPVHYLFSHHDSLNENNHLKTGRHVPAYPGYWFGPLMTISLSIWKFRGVTLWGKVSLDANTIGMPISLVAIYGSGEMTERAAKFTRFPIMCILKRPSFFSSNWKTK